MKKIEIDEILNYEGKIRFVEILLVIATILTTFPISTERYVLIIPIFIVFIISSLLYIIMISLNKKVSEQTTKEYNRIWLPLVFSTIFLSISFSVILGDVFLQAVGITLITALIELFMGLTLGYLLFYVLFKTK